MRTRADGRLRRVTGENLPDPFHRNGGVNRERNRDRASLRFHDCQLPSIVFVDPQRQIERLCILLQCAHQPLYARDRCTLQRGGDGPERGRIRELEGVRGIGGRYISEMRSEQIEVGLLQSRHALKRAREWILIEESKSLLVEREFCPLHIQQNQQSLLWSLECRFLSSQRHPLCERRGSGDQRNCGRHCPGDE